MAWIQKAADVISLQNLQSKSNIEGLAGSLKTANRFHAQVEEDVTISREYDIDYIP